MDDLYLELDTAQRDSRQLSSEAHKLRGHHDALVDQVEGLKRENGALSAEVRLKPIYLTLLLQEILISRPAT